MDMAPEGARVVVQHYVNTSNDPARRLLEASGYAAVRGYYRMTVHLRQTPPPPGWPEGIGLRTFMSERDERTVYEAVEDAFRDVWGRPRGTLERFLGFTRQEGLDPGLWFLAEGDGEKCCVRVLNRAPPQRLQDLQAVFHRHLLSFPGGTGPSDFQT
jgi:hypothetical protein